MVISAFVGGPRDGGFSAPCPATQLRAVYRLRGGRYVYLKKLPAQAEPEDPVDAVLWPVPKINTFTRCVYVWEAGA